MRIQHNISAMNSHKQMKINNNSTAKNLQKLSSGFRINKAGDDAAGLAISEKMRGQIRGLSMAKQNTTHGINLIQTAEGGLSESHSILQRMRELAVQSANGTYHDETDRANIEKEYKALMEEVDRIAESTHYNGIKLLNGNLSHGMSNEDVFRMLYGSWLSDAANLIAGSLGMGLNNDINLDVSFKSLASNTVAYMQHSYNNKDYSLVFNSKYLSSTDEIPEPNGPITGGIMLDRIVAHEMVHALMAHNSADPASLPLWYKEGVAEAIHGASYRYNDFSSQSQIDKAASEIANFPASATGGGEYTVGYLVVSYLDNLGGSNRIKDLTTALKTQSFDDAIQSTYGQSLNSIITTMKSEAASNITDFIENECKIGINDGLQDGLGNRDTNAIDAVSNNPGTPADISSSGKDTLSLLGFNVNITWSKDKTPLILQIGANAAADQIVKLSINSMNPNSLGIENTSIATRDSANAAIANLTEAINSVSATRADLGAMQNRLEHTFNNLGVSKENLTAAESSIRDVDMAKEMMEFTKNNILMQASQSMLTQANQLPQGILQLLR